VTGEEVAWPVCFFLSFPGKFRAAAGHGSGLSLFTVFRLGTGKGPVFEFQ